mgnify:CR=1 FL=1
MNNARAFLRKHPEGRWKSFLRFQHLYVWPVLMLFPNQHFGQFIQYTIALFRGRSLVPFFLPMLYRCHSFSLTTLKKWY